MKLYTIELTFSDFTYAVEQYEGTTPEDALEMFFTNAECLESYDRSVLLRVIKKRINDKNILIQAANNLRGVWIINVGTDFQTELGEDNNAIYGGIIIQTDPHGPRKS